MLLVHHEEAPSGLLIVRAQDSQPANHADAQSQPRFASQPPTGLLSHQPPSKKFKADSQPSAQKPPSQTRTRQRATDTVASDLEVEKDVRAMDDEADKLRRLSRARTVIDPTLLSSQANVPFSSRPETPGVSRKGKSKAVEISMPLPEQETPRIQRNKQLRSNAMAAIANGRTPETPSTTPNRHRRKSSVSGRGKRVSTSFEATGVISKLFSVRWWIWFVLLFSSSTT